MTRRTVEAPNDFVLREEARMGVLDGEVLVTCEAKVTLLLATEVAPSLLARLLCGVGTYSGTADVGGGVSVLPSEAVERQGGKAVEEG